MMAASIRNISLIDHRLTVTSQVQRYGSQHGDEDRSNLGTSAVCMLPRHVAPHEAPLIFVVLVCELSHLFILILRYHLSPPDAKACDLPRA